MRSKPTLATGMESIARSLREFGYPDVTGPLIRECYDAWLAGKRGHDLPHGVVGMFAEREFEEHEKMLASLPK